MQGPTILIVEDEALVRAFIASELEDAGYEVVEAGDGHAAISILAEGRPVDLLFTDIRMPGELDGWAVAEHARQIRPDLPVFYASGFSDEAPRLVAGGRFFKKPYRANLILAAMQELGLRPPS